MQGLIMITHERCKGCALCIEFCPKKAISLTDRLNQKGYFVAAMIENAECTGCGTCALMCPEVAIEVTKQ